MAAETPDPQRTDYLCTHRKTSGHEGGDRVRGDRRDGLDTGGKPGSGLYYPEGQLMKRVVRATKIRSLRNGRDESKERTPSDT